MANIKDYLSVPSPVSGSGGGTSSGFTALTTANAPASPSTGEAYFDTDVGKPFWWDGVGWNDAIGVTRDGAQFWRVLIDGSVGGTYATIQEIEMYEESPGVSNVCIPSLGTASALSRYSSSYPATDAYDGDTTTNNSCWITPANQFVGNWWLMSYVQPREIKEIKIMVQQGLIDRGISAFRIQKSTDGALWATVATFTGQTYVDGVYNTYVI